MKHTALLSLIGALACAAAGHAQTVTTDIATDGSLGAAQSIPGVGGIYTIDENLGQRSGTNLFHSFGRFDVGSGDTARFTADPALTTDNIISRVTGGVRSQVFGTIQSQVPGANLYLLNPAGIVFGAGAQLDIAGSFHASSADVLRFASGEPFTTQPSAAVSLSSAAPSAFGFLGDQPAAITLEEAGLELQSGEGLSLVGGSIRIATSGATPAIRLASGRLSIVSAGGKGDVQIAQHADGLELTAAPDLVGGELELDGATVRLDGPGSVQVQAGSVTLRDGSRLTATADGGGRIGGDLLLRGLDGGGKRTTTLALGGESVIDTDSFFGGISGDLTIEGFDEITLSERSQIRSDAVGSARTGNVQITGAETLVLRDRSEISSAAFLSSNQNLPAGEAPGDVTIEADSIQLLTGGSIETVSVSSGSGGNVFITARELVADGAYLDPNLPELAQPSGVSSTIGFAQHTADPITGGDIEITADEIRLTDGGRIAAETVAFGQGGDIRITANRILVSGVNEALGAAIEDFDETLVGLSTDLQVVRDPEDFTHSAIATSSLLAFYETGPDQLTAYDVGGPAGSISIDAGSLQLGDGGFVAAFSQGEGDAGSIDLAIGGDLDLLGASQITTRADEAGGGNITLNASALTLLGSSIESSVGSGVGSGGNVSLSTGVAALNQSQILARADAGRGGNISISAEAFLQTPGSLINASSNVGLDGDIAIDSPDANVEGGIAQLPADFLSASSMMRPSCAARGAQPGGSFAVARRKGVAASPDGLLLAFDALDTPSTLAAEGGLPQVASAEPQLVAQADAEIGTALRGGHFETAGSAFRSAAETRAQQGDDAGQAAALRGLAQTQQAMGRYLESAETLRGALELAESAGDSAGMASALGSLGNVYVALGQGEEAEKHFARGIVLAQSAQRPDLASGLLNNLGNHHSALDAHAQALAAYEQAARIAHESGAPLQEARALTNAARAAVDAGRTEHAYGLLARVDSALASLPRSAERVYLQINQARTWQRVAEEPQHRERGLLAAHSALMRAAELAGELDSPRALSFALGNLGQLYESERRSDEALYLTRAALRAAEQADAPESEYRWHWQEARLLWAQGQAAASIAAYQRAVAILEETRQEAQGRYGEAVAYFRRAVAPVYLELVEVLLASADRAESPEALLVQARGTVEQLKAAELRDYFRDECVAELEAKTAELDRVADQAAVVYPIVLPARLELLVTLPGGLHRYSAAVGEKQLTESVRRFRRELMNPSGDAYRSTSRELYDWLVRPYAADLAEAGVKTLVFVPDGALRTVPMAALHDGENFVGSRFAIAVTPSLALVDPQPLNRENVHVLAGGVSESVSNFPPLAMVPAELEAVKGIYGGEVLLDADFRLARIEQEIALRQPNVVHIASHAVFTGDPETSFVLTHDDRLTMSRLSSVVGLTRFRDQPLELLVLSACETAAGNDRAGLGLAGVAIRAGARSALGSLWSIADEAAYQLVSDFYRELNRPGTSKAVALQRAQARLRENPAFAHPFYWSPFLIINNWL